MTSSKAASLAYASPSPYRQGNPKMLTTPATRPGYGGGAASSTIGYYDDRSHQSDKEEDEEEIRYRYNKMKNQHSEFYESLKENIKAQSVERLPVVSTILEQTAVTPSPLYSPAKIDTLKMRKMRELKGRSAARRIQLELMDSPERQTQAMEEL